MSASGLKKRSVLIAGHPTSVTLEQPFWDALKRLAAERGRTVAGLIEEIDRERDGNLSSAIRVWVLLAVQESGATTDRGTPGPHSPQPGQGVVGGTKR